MTAKTNGNGKRHATQQSVNSAVKAICDIMRRSNCAGALQYVPELTWILFLRILDERESRESEAADAVNAEFSPSLTAPYRWQDWAAPAGTERKKLETGALGAFFSFVNGKLIPLLKELREQPNATPRQKVISEIFSGVERTRIDTERNFLDVLDKVHEISAETVYDPGCGTGGFLAQSFEHMAGPSNSKIKAPDQLEALKHRTFFGREKDNTIYPIALANLVLHNIDEPRKPTETIWYYDLSDIKVGKRTPFTLDKFEDFFRLLPTRGDRERSWTVTRAQIEAKNYDLKAVNPNRKSNEDTRTPEELLAVIEAKGREVSEALAALRK